jgi:tetratricopeptide (TPR) repeat protein
MLLPMRRSVIFSVGLAALTVGVVFAWYAVRQEREYRRLITAGDAALARDRTSDAIEAFSGALALKGDSMLAHLKRGDTYRRRGELDAALRDLRQAATLDPSAPRAAELLGDVNAALGHYDRAVEQYRTFTQLDDLSPRVLYKLGLAHYRNGHPMQAIEPLQRALALNARFAEGHYLLGMCLREGRDTAGALRALTRAIEIDGAFVAAREELVDLLEETGRRRDAIEQLEALAALEPARPERLVDVGLAYARWGWTDTAVLTLGRAAERYPGRDDVYVALGRVWLDMAESSGDEVALSKAFDALRSRARADNASNEALTLFGRALFLSGDITGAERTLLRAAAMTPIDPITLRYLAEASERLGHSAQARAARARYGALTGT